MAKRNEVQWVLEADLEADVMKQWHLAYQAEKPVRYEGRWWLITARQAQGGAAGGVAIAFRLVETVKPE